MTFPSGGRALPVAALPAFPSRVGGSRWHPPLRPEPRGTRAILEAGVLALAGSTGLAPGSFPALLAFLVGEDVSPWSCVTGTWLKIPKPAPGDGVSVHSPWCRERWGSAVSRGVHLRHPAARAPQNPRILGQGGPQEGAQSFQDAEGSTLAEPGVQAAPAPKAGVRLLRGSLPAPGECRGTGQAKGHPVCPQSPAQAGQGIWMCRLRLSGGWGAALQCSRTSVLTPTSSSGSIKIMSRAN